MDVLRPLDFLRYLIVKLILSFYCILLVTDPEAFFVVQAASCLMSTRYLTLLMVE